MKCKTTFILSLLLLMTLYHMSDALTPKREYILQKFHVRVANELPEKSPMGIHCKSGDDDLGMQRVEAHQEYGFSFRLNLFKTTRFWCLVRWENDDVSAIGDVFWPADDFLTRCRHNSCVWIVDEDGFQFHDPDTDDIFSFYQWE